MLNGNPMTLAASLTRAMTERCARDIADAFEAMLTEPMLWGQNKVHMYYRTYESKITDYGHHTGPVSLWYVSIRMIQYTKTHVTNGMVGT